MTAKNIALLAGGFTGEYDVSINSATNIAKSLNKEKYNIYTILLSRDSWYYELREGGRAEIDKNDFSLPLNGIKIKFDAAFITIHGSPGEDGKLQGYFDLLGIPYNTCDTATAALTMNKAYTKAVVKDVPDLAVAKSAQVFSHNRDEAGSLVVNLQYPLFIKPNNGGSSVGMSKINNPDELDGALQKAFDEDDQVLIEEFIKGREFSIGAVRLNSEIKVLPPTEIISSKDFFDYEAKYTPGITEEVTPADLQSHQVDNIVSIVKQVYHLLNCKGMARVDFIIQENTGKFYFIEINTTPGQSAASIYPQQVRAAGMDVGEFYGMLIEESLKTIS